MYLGDISFRWANDKDKKESQRLMKSIPGIKILVLGNHDIMAGDEYYTGCGFDYVYERVNWNNYVFTHKPIIMDFMPEDYLNIHGHMHNVREYNTTDGRRNINVYPLFFDNKPVTLDYILNHVDELIKDNKRSNWTNIGESSRADLPDSKFGIPEDRKFPLDSKKHVQSAIRLFGHAEESKKKDLAKRIKTAANSYDLRIPETTQVYKYLAESKINDEDIINIPPEVENIVFDMGNVLVSSDLLNTLKLDSRIPTEYAEDIYNAIIEHLFIERKMPNLFHETLPNVKEYFASLLPDHIKQYIDQIFDDLEPALYRYDYVDDLLTFLRSKGYHLYYLSNWDRFSYEVESNFFTPLISKFDGGLFSFETTCEKPSLTIYRNFLNKFNLIPSKCIFFDDKQENVDAAINCGFYSILFDHKTTAYKIMTNKPNIKNAIIPEDHKYKIPIFDDDGLKYINATRIRKWYVSDLKDLKDISLFVYDDLDLAISCSINDKDFEEDYFDHTNKHVYIVDEDNKAAYVGSIVVLRNKNWQWDIQIPVQLNGKNYIKQIDEWAMAACNPVIGITKPFVLKICNDSGGLINSTVYGLANDLIPDKCLVINENAQLEVVSGLFLRESLVEVYKFTGDQRNIKKIEEAYKTGKIVDNTYIYTSLTGKPMLTEDQIDFDESFEKVDFTKMKESILSTMATLKEGFLNSCDIPSMEVNISESYTDEYISLNKDQDGFFVRNKLSGKRSASVESKSYLTNKIIKSVLS
jgi:putative hydrolase of the HAD superfamily